MKSIPFGPGIGLFILLCGLQSGPLEAAVRPLSTPRVKSLTEKLLKHLNQKQYRAAFQMMGPRIRRSLSLVQFRAQLTMVMGIVGQYKARSLHLISKLTLRGQVRYIWKARFKKEKGLVLLLLSPSNQISGLIIQSKTLRKRMRKLRAANRPKALLMRRFKAMATELMLGFNQGQWLRFCRHCSPVMKQVFTQARFLQLRKVLLKRYGAHVSLRFKSIHRLISLKQALVVRYQGKFRKKSGLTVQFVFQKIGKKYKIASWRLR